MLGKEGSLPVMTREQDEIKLRGMRCPIPLHVWLAVTVNLAQRQILEIVIVLVHSRPH